MRHKHCAAALAIAILCVSGRARADLTGLFYVIGLEVCLLAGGTAVAIENVNSVDPDYEGWQGGYALGGVNLAVGAAGVIGSGFLMGSDDQDAAAFGGVLVVVAAVQAALGIADIASSADAHARHDQLNADLDQPASGAAVTIRVPF